MASSQIEPVNEQKSSVRPARGCEFLGFAFVGKRVTITVAPKKLKTFKRRVKELTGRMAIKHAISRKSYWRLSRTPAMRYAMPNKWLEQLGLLSLKQLWCDLAPLRGTA
jgi:hypothetical protein